MSQRVPEIVELDEGHLDRSLADLARLCLSAAVVVADGQMAERLSASGHRGLVVASRSEAEQLVADWSTVGAPTIVDGHLSTGSDGRRHTTLDGECLSNDEVARRLDAAKPIVPESWDGYVAAHGKRFVETLSLVPQAPLGARALDASAFPLTIRYLTDLGYWVAGTLFAEDRDADARPASGFWVDAGAKAEVWYDAERHRLPCDDEMFDLVLAGEIIEHMPTDPVQLLVDFNRVLRTGGLLVLTTPNIISRHSIAQALNGRHPFNYPLFEREGSMDRHHQEFTPSMLATMVRRAGFHLDLLTTVDVWFPDEPEVTELIIDGGYDQRMRGDSLFVVARKVSSIVDRTPAGIYTGDESTWALSQHVVPRRHGAPTR
ncbi:MAG: methyltransferase domain-containing protein [Acidimicrobiales bacterium]